MPVGALGWSDSRSDLYKDSILGDGHFVYVLYALDGVGCGAGHVFGAVGIGKHGNSF